MDLKKFKTKFDLVLKKYLDQKIKQNSSMINDKKVNKYIQYINDFIFSGGKRLRPYWLYLTYKWLGGQNDKAILYFGIIFELLHSMALIHDDIIDQAEIRHNIPTMHKHILWLLHKKNEHLAQWEAILIWDLMLSRVYELLYSDHKLPDKFIHKARENVNTMIQEVIIWQMIDVYLVTDKPAPISLITKKSMYKTSFYTFVRPMLTGAIFAWADTKTQDLITQLWKNLWIAFQIRDDLFDLLWLDHTKSAFNDVQEWQQTFFTNYIFQKWSSQDKKLLLQSMGKKLNKTQINQLRKIFDSCWAIDYWKKQVKIYSNKASQSLNQIKFKDSKSLIQIQNLINKISDLKI